VDSEKQLSAFSCQLSAHPLDDGARWVFAASSFYSPRADCGTPRALNYSLARRAWQL